MGVLILFAILVPAVFLILLLMIYSRVNENRDLMQSVDRRLKRLEEQKEVLVKPIEKTETEVKPEHTTEPIATPPSLVFPTSIIEPTPLFIQEEIPAIKEYKPVPEQEPEPLPSFDSFSELLKAKTRQVDSPSRKERDLEKFIGENLANKIGIAILVLGIGFFVKYAIDKNWINETGRVLIGFACGMILLFFAHRIRNAYRSFSSVLVGGGLAVFYFTIAFAFQEYHLLGQKVAFVSMLATTALAVGLSVFYDRLELAILATVGGFITPFLLSTGQDNYQALFTYIAILNAGWMTLSVFKRWPVVNFIALFFTVFIVSFWFIDRKYLNDEPIPLQPALLYFSLFYLEFVAMNILHQVAHKRPFLGFDFMVLLGVNGLYFAAGYNLYEAFPEKDQSGLFSALLGLFNLALYFFFRKKSETDPGFVRLLLGLGLAFLTLAIPVLFNGHIVTLFWAAESLILFWIFQRSRMKVLLLSLIVVVPLMLISLLEDWGDAYMWADETLPILFNKGVISTLAVAIALFGMQVMHRKEADTYLTGALQNKAIKTFLLIAGYLVVWIGGVLEIDHQIGSRWASNPLKAIYIPLYTFLTAAFILTRYRKNAGGVLRITITTLCVGLYLYFLEPQEDATFYIINQGKSSWNMVGHFTGVALLCYLLYELVHWFRFNGKEWASYKDSFTWLFSASIVLILSVELYHLMLWIYYTPQGEIAYLWNLYAKAGLSIIWGVCSFAFMWVGMQKKFRMLRIISLSLFSVTLVKLFLYDIRNIPPGGKIAAFILLGVLLLVISFMYQRLKKVVLEE